MRFHTKILARRTRKSEDGDSVEYKILASSGVSFAKVPAYEPERRSLYQVLSEIATGKRSPYPSKISLFVKGGIAYATDGRIMMWVDQSLIDESCRLKDGIHYNSAQWNPEQDRTEHMMGNVITFCQRVMNGFASLPSGEFAEDKEGYYTRIFTVKHMPKIKKAAHSFYFLCTPKDCNWYSVNIPVGETLHTAGANLFAIMDAFYSLMSDKSFPRVRATAEIPDLNGQYNNCVYLDVEGFDYSRFGAVITGYKHDPEHPALLWTDPDAVNEPNVNIKTASDDEKIKESLHWGDVKLVPIDADNGREASMAIRVPGKLTDCVQCKNDQGDPELRFLVDEVTMKVFCQKMNDYFEERSRNLG